MVAAGRLSHLTLNTGHIAVSDRSAVSRAVLDELMPIIDAQGGPIPRMDGWYLDAMVPLDKEGRPTSGAAFFQIADEPGLSKRPIIMAMVCWRRELGDEAWREITHAYEAQAQSLKALKLWRLAPPAPPPIPWLAVMVTPFMALADQETIRLLGDLERCIAWGVMEGA